MSSDTRKMFFIKPNLNNELILFRNEAPKTEFPKGK